MTIHAIERALEYQPVSNKMKTGVESSFAEVLEEKTANGKGSSASRANFANVRGYEDVGGPPQPGAGYEDVGGPPVAWVGYEDVGGPPKAGAGYEDVGGPPISNAGYEDVGGPPKNKPGLSGLPYFPGDSGEPADPGPNPSGLPYYPEPNPSGLPYEPGKNVSGLPYSPEDTSWNGRAGVKTDPKVGSEDSKADNSADSSEAVKDKATWDVGAYMAGVFGAGGRLDATANPLAGLSDTIAGLLFKLDGEA